MLAGKEPGLALDRTLVCGFRTQTNCKNIIPGWPIIDPVPYQKGPVASLDLAQVPYAWKSLCGYESPILGQVGGGATTTALQSR